MTNSRLLRTTFRSLAVLIAIAAVIDPAITTHRAAKPRVAVVSSATSRDSSLTRDVKRTLEKRFSVIGAPFSAGDATVLIGDYPGATFRDLSQPLFVVLGESGTHVAIEKAFAPATAPLDARVPVTVVARMSGAQGKTLDVTLTHNGVVVDRVSRPVATDGRVQVDLSFTPASIGPAALRVAASLGAARDSASADVVTDVRDTRWQVLFYDPRPSWMSTFVRRVIEHDPRFIVTSRVITSRNVSTDAGNPPSSLDDFAGISRFDAIIIGAPDTLSTRDVAGLDAFARRRGGSIVFLYDEIPTGRSLLFTHADAWATRASRQPIPVIPMAKAPAVLDSVSLLATELSWPVLLPYSARVLATTVAAKGDSLRDRAVLWSEPIGAGRLVVSTALDSWRFRDLTQSAFDRLWQTVLADAAAAAPPPISVRVSPAALAPRDSAEVTVTLRDVALRDATSQSAPTSIEASIIAPGTSGRRTSLRLWPAADVGEFRATVRAPDTTGVYRIAITGDGVSAEAPMIVSVGATHATPSNIDLLEAVATATGGKVISSAHLDQLGGALASVIKPVRRLESWHPMRSAWWILPFALALSADWLLRRRASLR